MNIEMRKFFSEAKDDQENAPLMYEDWKDGKLKYWYYRDKGLMGEFIPAWGKGFEDEGEGLNHKESPMYGMEAVATVITNDSGLQLLVSELGYATFTKGLTTLLKIAIMEVSSGKFVDYKNCTESDLAEFKQFYGMVIS